MRAPKIAAEPLGACKSVEHHLGEEVDGWEDEQERIEAVEEASVAGQYRAHVFDAQVSLE